MSIRDDIELGHTDELPDYDGMSERQLVRQQWAYEAFKCAYQDRTHTLMPWFKYIPAETQE